MRRAFVVATACLGLTGFLFRRVWLHESRLRSSATKLALLAFTLFCIFIALEALASFFPVQSANLLATRSARRWLEMHRTPINSLGQVLQHVREAVPIIGGAEARHEGTAEHEHRYLRIQGGRVVFDVTKEGDDRAASTPDVGRALHAEIGQLLADQVLEIARRAPPPAR